MSDPSFSFLPMFLLEQQGWLSLSNDDGFTVTAKAIIGHIDEDSLIILSSFTNREIPLDSITTVEFSYHESTGVYKFTSPKFEPRLREDGRLMLRMLPPYEMNHMQQREFIRIEPEVPRPVYFTPLETPNARPSVGKIIDVSGSGLRFVTNEYVNADSHLQLSFTLPESNLEVKAVVQVVRKVVSRIDTIVSLRIVEIAPQDQKAILTYSIAEHHKMEQNRVKQKRKYGRMNIVPPIAMIVKDDDRDVSYEGEAHNIGGGGIMLTVPAELPDSSSYTATIVLHENSGAIEARAKVAYKQTIQDETFLHLEFEEFLTPKGQETIIDFVLDIKLTMLTLFEA